MVCAFLKCGNLKISQIHTEGLFFYIELFTLKYNENYVLDEVWVKQPGADNGKSTTDGFVIYKTGLKENDQGEVVERIDPSHFIFTNNPNNENISKIEKNVSDVDRGGNPRTYNSGIINDDKNYVIPIQQGTIIRLVFDITDNPAYAYPKDDVKFFDYDITDGYIYTDLNAAKIQDTSAEKRLSTSQQQFGENAPQYFVNTVKQGINNEENVKEDEKKDEKARFAFGNSNTGTTLGDVTRKNKFSQNTVYINKANGVNGGTLAVDKTAFALVKGLKPNGTLNWADDIVAPAIFDTARDHTTDNPILGKTNYVNHDYRLIFHREGGTYTLNEVQQKVPDSSDSWKSIESATNLEKFTKREYSTGSVIWSNNFWPMDAAPSYGTDGHDLKFGLGRDPEKYVGTNPQRQYYDENSANKANNLPLSDDNKDHNAYFGMSFDVFQNLLTK